MEQLTQLDLLIIIVILWIMAVIEFFWLLRKHDKKEKELNEKYKNDKLL